MNDLPRDVLIKCFPSLAGHMPISGGWGRTLQDACCIECDSAFSLAYDQEDYAWHTIFVFVEKSIYMELIVSQPLNNRCSGISWQVRDRQTKVENGRIYEWLVYEVSAFADKDWEILKSEWEGPEGFRSDGFDIEAHIRRRAAFQKTNFHEYWFDITHCYSISLFDIQLPWVIDGFCRGSIVNYESQVVGQGYSVAYHGLLYPSLAEATVYFYTKCVTDIPQDCDDERIIDAFRDAVDEVISVNENVFKSECKVVRAGKYTLNHEGLVFLHAEFDIASSRERKRSHIFFRGHAGRYLKVRVSLPADEKFEQVPFIFIQEFSDLAGITVTDGSLLNANQ